MVVDRIKHVAEEIKKMKESNDFVQEYNNLLLKKEVVISNMDSTNRADQFLVLETVLRGKSEDDYFSLVFGLMEMADTEENKKRKSAIHELTNRIMSIGERNLGIDWS